MGSTLDRKRADAAIPQLSAELNYILDNNVKVEKIVVQLSGGKAKNMGEYVAYFKDLTTGYFTAIAGDVQFLTSREAYLNHLNSDIATIGYIKANDAVIGALQADTAKIHNLTATELSAATGYISTLKSNNIETSNIIADHAAVSNLDTNYARITSGKIDSALINTAAIVDEQVFTVTGNKATLQEINAANIRVINLQAENLTISTAGGYVTIGNKRVPTKEFLDSLTDELEKKIDGAIETWSGSAVPTLNNYPASDWIVPGDPQATDEERAKHVGDVYYVVNSQLPEDGRSYRFVYDNVNTLFKWSLIQDSDITAALQRIAQAEDDIDALETFQVDTADWIEDAEGEFTSIKGRTSTLETTMGNKVNTSTFNTLSQTVSANTADITSLSTTVQAKADGSTVSTLSNTVNNISQTATSNSSHISSLTQTLGTNADGTTKANDIVHRTSDIEQDLSGFKSTVASTYATKVTVNGKANTSDVYTKSEINQTVNNINASVSAKADGASTTAALSLKANKDTLTSEINASADTVKIEADRLEIATSDTSPSTGVMIHKKGDSTTGWHIADALELLKNGVAYIWAGLVNNIATVRVGKETGGHSVIDENGMRVYGSSNGGTQLANIGYGSGTDSGGGTSNAPYYTLGFRNDGTIGNYSVCEGSSTKATNYAAHAEGSNTQALGPYSHAEGRSTIARGQCSHAEGGNSSASGNYAHAEGRDTSAVAESHSEGSHTEAQAVFAHVQNVGTITSMAAQTVIGTFNTLDTMPTPSGPHNGMYIDEHVIASMDFGNWALVIGNGTSENSRSNALTVDWNGNIEDGNGYSFIKCISGTSGNWSYKKYADGTFDAWYNGTLTYSNDGQLSSYNPTWYRSHVSVTVPSAIGTVTVQTYSFSLSSASNFTMMGYSSASGSTLTQYVVRGGGSLASDCTATCYVHGTWT